MNLIFLSSCCILSLVYCEEPPPYYFVSIKQTMLQSELRNFTGVYCRTRKQTMYQDKSYYGYKHETETMYLRLSLGFWEFRPTLDASSTALESAYYNNNYPGKGKVDWMHVIVTSVGSNPLYKTRCAKMSINEDIPGKENITAKLDDANNSGNTKSRDKENNKPFAVDVNDDNGESIKNKIIISLAVVLIIIVGCIIIGIYLYIKKKEQPEEPVMEKNEMYGEDDEYYDEHDNRVEDRNDYYES